MSQTFSGYSPPLIKHKSSYHHGSKSEQVSETPTYFHVLVPFWVSHKMFKVLTICRNTSVETSHHGFPDAFQLTWSVSDDIKFSYDAFPQLIKVSNGCGSQNLSDSYTAVDIWEPVHFQTHVCDIAFETHDIYIYTGCHRRNGQNFGRVFLVLNYTVITQNTYIRSWTLRK